MLKQLHPLKTWAAAAVGTVITLAGVFADGDFDAADVRCIGVLVALGGVVWAVTHSVARPTNAAYELGHGDGYRNGYDDGRQIAKPTVVQLRACKCGRPEETVSRRSP